MGGAPPPSPIRMGGGAFLLSLSLFLLLLLQLGKGGNLLLLGVGIPLRARHTEGRPSPPPLLYIRGRGHPIDTQVDYLAMCSAPSTYFHLGHIVVVLRRSPASVTSLSPSTRRRADATHPRLQLDQEYEERHRDERVQIAEVSCVRYLISWIAKTFDYINHVTKRFRFRSTRVRRHTLPSRCYASPG